MHYANKPARGTRYYRESLDKLAEAGAAFVKQKPSHLIELGDFIDSADSVAEEKNHLKIIQTKFAELPGRKHYVLGNHCVHTLTKAEFLHGVEREKSFYSFDEAGYHFVILDACFRSDGVPYQRKNFEWTDPNIPVGQLEWLAADLRKANRPTIVFVHQRLDLSNHYAVKNAAAVRKILESSGVVKAVFQGHSHKNDYREINGIHYTTLVVMVEGSGAENNSYSLLDIFADGTLALSGFRQQKNYRWE